MAKPVSLQASTSKSRRSLWRQLPKDTHVCVSSRGPQTFKIHQTFDLGSQSHTSARSHAGHVAERKSKQTQSTVKRVSALSRILGA